MSERKLFAHELEARLDELLLLTLRQRSAALPAAQLEALPRQQQERVLHWVGIAAQTSTELGWAIAQRAGTRAAQPGFALDDWARAGLEAHDAGGLAAAQARLDEYAAAAPDSASAARGVTFAAVEGRLAGFLHALDGRPMQLRCGPRTWTDGETLWLPESLDLAADAAGNRRLYTVIAALLWAQARFGTFNVDPEPELVQWADRDTALDWFSLFEGMRLEARLALDLPGLARDMAALRGPWPAELAPVAARLARPEASAADSLACMAELRRVGAGDTAHPPYRTTLDPLAARRLRAARIARDAGTLRRALNIMRAIDPHSRGGASDSEYPPLAADGDSVPAELQSGDLQGLPPDARAAAQSLAQDLDGIPPELLRPAGPGAWRPEDRDEGDGAVAAASGEPDALYDEWDYRRGAWRRDWCHLYESEDRPGNTPGSMRCAFATRT
ncbi:MAG: hypothetical protein IPL72_06485 [Sulfuritalea sp.]|nr:hypothetical protein [Sulfuritalea sp.]